MHKSVKRRTTDFYARVVTVKNAIGSKLIQLILVLSVVLFVAAIPGIAMAAEERGDAIHAGGSWIIASFVVIAHLHIVGL
jgi:hypothetical protein